VNKIVTHMMVSLDGFFEGPEGSLEWHMVDEELHQYFNDGMRDAGAFIGGRLNYQLMEAFWPTADEGEDVPPTMAEFAGIWRRVPKVVYSTTLDTVGDNATLRGEVDPDEVRRLRDEASGDLFVGGAILGQSFLDLGLIDEVRIYVNPLMLGSGRRPFRSPSQTVPLTLLESRAFTNGVVLLRYAVG
jgi:dihydrofolate reductase